MLPLRELQSLHYVCEQRERGGLWENWLCYSSMRRSSSAGCVLTQQVRFWAHNLRQYVIVMRGRFTA